MRYRMHRLLRGFALSAATVVLLSASAATAATFVYAGYVSSDPASPPPSSVFPAPGTRATIRLTIDDTSPGRLLSDVNPPDFLSASLVVPGFMSGSMSGPLGEPSAFDEFGFNFGNYGAADIVTPGPGNIFHSYGLHRFSLNFGSAPALAPATIGDLVAAVITPGASGYFSHQFETDAGGFPTTRVSFPVPLPAGLSLSLIGLLALAGLSRRRLNRA